MRRRSAARRSSPRTRATRRRGRRRSRRRVPRGGATRPTTRGTRRIRSRACSRSRRRGGGTCAARRRGGLGRQRGAHVCALMRTQGVDARRVLRWVRAPRSVALRHGEALHAERERRVARSVHAAVRQPHRPRGCCPRGGRLGPRGRRCRDRAVVVCGDALACHVSGEGELEKEGGRHVVEVRVHRRLERANHLRARGGRGEGGK